MSDRRYLEAGTIINTHGVRGELKVDSWLDEPELFGELSTLQIGGKDYSLLSARTQGRFALIKLEGVNSIDDALPLKNKVALALRDEIPVPEGCHFIADLIGMDAINDETNEVFGKVKDILEYPAQDLYLIEGKRRYLIPDVPAFVHEIDEETHTIRFTVLEGMDT